MVPVNILRYLNQWRSPPIAVAGPVAEFLLPDKVTGSASPLVLGGCMDAAMDQARSWRGVFTGDRLHHVTAANARRVPAGNGVRLGLAECGAVCVPPVPEQWPLPPCAHCHPESPWHA